MFPRIILEGDKDAAAQLIKAGLGVLHKARLMQQAGSAVVGVTNRLGSGGASASARIVGGHEVLRIFAPSHALELPGEIGLELLIYSGVVRHYLDEADIVEVPVGESTERRLRSFQPTAECWQSVMGKPADNPPGQFNDIAALAVSDGGSGGTSSQYRSLRPAMFSGRMCKLVQILMGYGLVDPNAMEGADDAYLQEVATDGLRIKLGYSWTRSHILTQAVDGKMWLVEIGAVNGVLAMRVPVLDDVVAIDMDQDVQAAAAEYIKGLPTGEVFPTGPKLATALTRGTVLRAAPASALSAFYDGFAPSELMGWSTNSLGRGAHNIRCRRDSEGRLFFAHYRIAIEISATNPDAPAGQPKATASAQLELVEEGQCLGTPHFKYWDGGSFVKPSAGTWTPPVGLLTTYPAYVAHIGEQLRIVHAASGFSSTRPDENHYSAQGAGVFDGVMVPRSRGVFREEVTSSSSSSSTGFGSGWTNEQLPAELVALWSAGGNFAGIVNAASVIVHLFNTENRLDNDPAYGLAPEGSRDSYVIAVGRLRTYVRASNDYGGAIDYQHASPIYIIPAPTEDDSSAVKLVPTPAPNQLDVTLAHIAASQMPSGTTTDITYSEKSVLAAMSTQPNLLTVRNSPGYSVGTPTGDEITPSDYADTGSAGLRFFLTWSCLGRPHYSHSVDHLPESREPPNFALVGPLFAGSPTPSAYRHTFIGYT